GARRPARFEPDDRVVRTAACRQRKFQASSLKSRDTVMNPSTQASDVKSQTFRGLDPIRTELDNGVVLLAKHTTATPAVAINLAIRAGSSCDPPGWAGTAWLLSRVIDRGTATRPAAAIAEALDSRGITLTITVTRHLFTVACQCLSDDFEAVLALIGDVLMAPSVADSELAIRKGEVMTP